MQVENGLTVSQTAAALPGRGHGVLLHPSQRETAWVISRRPGTSALQVELGTGKVLRLIESEESRHFYGHACYSEDGKTVFTTENDIDTGQGIISVRDADDFRLLDEYASHGIGPHELLLMPDGATLAVANGGIKTFPETGRVKLNRGRIVSSLAYLDSRTGKLLGLYEVPLPQSSLRHLAVTPEGHVAGAMQFEGDKNGKGQALVIFHRGERTLQVAAAPQQDWDAMANYAASIAYDKASGHFVITCPLGDAIAFWHVQKGYAGLLRLPKASGIVFNESGGYVSNELGEIHELDLDKRKLKLHARLERLQWDNHLYSL